MRKIKLKNQTEESYEDETPDICDFNKELLKYNFSDISNFEVYSKGKQIKVDLENGEVFIDGEIYDLEIDETTKNKLSNLTLKWINFRRNTISRRMSGLESRKTAYGMGFQTTLDGKNFKRFILVDRNKIKLEKE